MRRPIIGITSYLEAARWGDWIREAVLLPTAYPREVDRAGGMPVAVPPTHPRGIEELVERFDGFVFTDGAHLAPALYKEQPHERTQEPDARRDRFESALVRGAMDAGIPFLGIARGAHLVNVAAGGNLLQYLPDVVEHGSHSPDPVKLGTHDVAVSVSSKIGAVLGDRVSVPESHTQGFNRMGTGIVPVAWANDQIVEAVEVADHPFGVGVQWHPEEGEDKRLFDALVAAARG